MVDTSLAALKFLAILVTGILAVVGLLVDYKKDGKVTVWGRRALLGSIASTLVAVATQSVETYKSRQEEREKADKALAQNENNAKLLEEIRRAIYPLQSVYFGMHVTITAPPPRIASYLKRLAPYVEKNRRYAESALPGEEPFVLVEDRAFLPRQNVDDVAFQLIRPEFVIRIFRTEERAKCFWREYKATSSSCMADAYMELKTSKEASLAIGSTTGALTMSVHDLEAKIDSAVGGEVASILDLKGAVMTIELKYGDNDDDWISQVRENAKIKALWGFKFGPYSIPIERTNVGEPSYAVAYRFPDSEEQLLRKASRRKA